MTLKITIWKGGSTMGNAILLEDFGQVIYLDPSKFDLVLK